MMGMSMILGSGTEDIIKSIHGLFAYWNADNAVLDATGLTVVRLADQSNNEKSARDLTPVTVGPSLTLVDSTFNDQPSVSSSITNIRMQATFDTNLTQPYTVYLVMNVFANANQMFWRSNAGNFVNSAGMSITAGPGTITTQTQDGANAITSVGSVVAGNTVSCCTYNSAGVSAVWLNDSQNSFATSPGAGTVDAIDCSVMTIGNFTNANTYAWTAMACYNGAHSGIQRRTLMNYLGTRYGIITT